MNQTHVLQMQNFVFLQAAKNGSLKCNCYFDSRAQWNALAKIWPASRQENDLFEVWPVGLIFFIFTSGGCNCFYEEKNKNSRMCKASQFAVCPETRVALDTANLVTFFFQKYGENAQNLF